MVVTIFWKFLITYSSLVLSSATTTFKEEQEKIMLKFDEVNSSFGPYCCTFIPKASKLTGSILALDPIVFFREMQEVNDDCFLIIFWVILDSYWWIICSKCSPIRDPVEFIYQISRNTYNNIIADEMLFHFKIYLATNMVNYPENKVELLNEANSFFNSRFKYLVRKVAGK